MRKLSFKEYSKRKLRHYRKARQRKKIQRKLDDLFLVYCIREYGVSIPTLLHATYDRYIEAVANSPNPFLNLIPKSDYTGMFMPIPVFYEEDSV